MVEVTFESGGQSYPDGLDWRPISAYEAALIELLLGFVEGERPFVPASVRALDECGCIEFDVGDAEGETLIVAEAALPPDHPQYPLEITMTIRGNSVLWLEFHHYGHDLARRPPAREFEVPHGGR